MEANWWDSPLVAAARDCAAQAVAAEKGALRVAQVNSEGRFTIWAFGTAEYAALTFAYDSKDADSEAFLSWLYTTKEGRRPVTRLVVEACAIAYKNLRGNT